MERFLYKELLKWKHNTNKKPLIIKGARQVGKTYLIREFCNIEYSSYIELNLFENNKAKKYFDKLVNFDEFETSFQMFIGRKIDFEKEIIFIDEIQESENAIFRLKQFNETNKYNIICAGSLLGIALNRMSKPFPVGQVEYLTLKPFTFLEFLNTFDEVGRVDYLISKFNNLEKIDEPLHSEILRLFNEYLIIGGMPQSILNYHKGDTIIDYNPSILESILSGYISDMSKYTKSSDESKVFEIFNNIPSQLRKQNKKFMLSHINLRNDYILTAKEWLINSGIVNIVYNLEIPSLPFNFYKQSNNFKLYFNDIGIFNSINKINQFNYLNIGDDYKGILAETYVTNVIKSVDNFYFNPNSGIEIDLLVEIKGDIVPIEIKYGTSIRSKSLSSYINKYNPKYCYRLSSRNIFKANKIIDIPLYLAELI